MCPYPRRGDLRIPRAFSLEDRPAFPFRTSIAPYQDPMDIITNSKIYVKYHVCDISPIFGLVGLKEGHRSNLDVSLYSPLQHRYQDWDATKNVLLRNFRIRSQNTGFWYTAQFATR